MAKRRAVLERVAGASTLAVAVGLAGCGSAGDEGNGANGSGGDGTGGGTEGGTGTDGGDSGGNGDSTGGKVTASEGTVKGVVKGKELVGANSKQPIVAMNETTIMAGDSAYDGRFTRGNFTVGDKLAEEMRSKHGELTYYVVLRLTTDDPSAEAGKGDRVAYVTEQQWFNAVRLGETVWARTGLDGAKPHITEFIGQ